MSVISHDISTNFFDFYINSATMTCVDRIDSVLALTMTEASLVVPDLQQQQQQQQNWRMPSIGTVIAIETVCLSA
jgi:hypothetical protein